MHTGSATCISVGYNDMHTGSATCISVWAIIICILVVPHVLVCGL